jgi:hypothetical protein
MERRLSADILDTVKDGLSQIIPLCRGRGSVKQWRCWLMNPQTPAASALP